MWVKICGITNLEDALCAIEAGADALGFVFYPKSPRYISPENARKIAEKLPLHVKKMGLFVDATAEEITFTCKEAKMDMAQIHFEVDDAFWSALKVPYLRVVRAQKSEDIESFKGLIRLVDAYVPSFGGAGQRLDLSWFEHQDCENIILAGGLTPENLEQIKPFGFYGVDVSSGVEREKGIKEHEKVREFIQRAKA
ncbi:MAG: phosphoribosylanthranilate isomerase [Campylobacterales bacterium]|uniref:N-(5'-phosphoribosyl)anthranilate isomerase n=1 Tax=Sulfurospirillum barnesii (strain ATCC 700032 / DSM 10660 / SES-3) TaxID=760154 RepID=I3XYD7_SULBS|nr:phosphoribosylanthranilate isomerase [Sulfurospirillum barnesii]AFL68961.1 phosphoribosylanthranilate isomerase [Sulfurospirillum barnesii SES-3]MBN1839824.1 phosphoribosylanthranilate isomerase [Campylobacterales bacterium]